VQSNRFGTRPFRVVQLVEAIEQPWSRLGELLASTAVGDLELAYGGLAFACPRQSSGAPPRHASQQESGVTWLLRGWRTNRGWAKPSWRKS